MEQPHPSLFFPSFTPRATTSPMRITTVHSVHLPFFLKFFYQPGHYSVPGRVLSTEFMVKFIVNPGKILCFTEVDVYAAAFALIVSMTFFISSQTPISVKISEMLPRSVNGDSSKTERSFIIPL
jgi:hypothetical protein